MTDDRPRSPIRTGLVAPLILGAVLLAVLGATLLFRAPKAPPPAPPPRPAPISQPVPEASPVLTRTELIQTANAVATSFADKVDLPTDRSPLLGRPFRIALAFGCNGAGPGAVAAPATAQYDPATHVLKLRANPIDLTALPLVQTLDNAGKIEAVEGFWIPRPWSHLETCPPRRQTPTPATETPPAAQTLGLAQYFEAGQPRTARRGDHAYEVARRIDDPDADPLAHPYSLILEGRIVGYADGRALRCWSESADHRPLCLYAVALDRVAFKDPAGGEVLGEWRQ
jgi:hypothetical protein